MQLLELQLLEQNYDPALHRLLEEVVNKVENPSLLSDDIVPVLILLQNLKPQGINVRGKKLIGV